MGRWQWSFVVQGENWERWEVHLVTPKRTWSLTVLAEDEATRRAREEETRRWRREMQS